MKPLLTIALFCIASTQAFAQKPTESIVRTVMVGQDVSFVIKKPDVLVTVMIAVGSVNSVFTNSTTGQMVSFMTDPVIQRWDLVYDSALGQIRFLGIDFGDVPIAPPLRSNAWAAVAFIDSRDPARIVLRSTARSAPQGFDTVDPITYHISLWY